MVNITQLPASFQACFFHYNTTFSLDCFIFLLFSLIFLVFNFFGKFTLHSHKNRTKE